jgi:hypothetical protein
MCLSVSTAVPALAIVLLSATALARPSFAQSAAPAPAPAATAPATAATPVSTSPAGPATPHHRMTLQQRFDAADTNHDGKLTREEADAGFPVLAKHFSAIDSTGKGYVTMADIKAYEQAWRKAHPRMTLQQRFEKADANHDGQLTEAEASAAGMKLLVKHFSEVDSTGKGYVTLADIHAYLHAKREAHKATVTN